MYVGSFEEVRKDRRSAELTVAGSQVLEIIERGERNRSIAETKMNKKSSRSHSVFMITVDQRNQQTNARKGAKLVMVDLAGSEKVRKTGAEGTVTPSEPTDQSLRDVQV